MSRDPWKTAKDRFISKVNKTKSCWLWTGCVDVGGYGQIRMGRKRSMQSHRLSYLIHKGEIPEGKIIMHLCDNPPCVNPEHLQAGTQSENILHARDIKPYPHKTKCYLGHTYSRITKNGWNRCRICHNRNATKSRRKICQERLQTQLVSS